MCLDGRMSGAGLREIDGEGFSNGSGAERWGWRQGSPREAGAGILASNQRQRTPEP